MLSVRNISKSYEKNSRQFKVLRDLSFDAEEGDFLLVSGISGIGKSTLLAIVSGFLRPTEGTVFFDDRDLFSLKDRELSEIHGSRISYVPQSNTMLSEMTVLENVLLPFSFSKNKKDEKEIRKKAKELLKEFGLEDQEEKFPYELSGGQLRRVVLTRALVTEPELIVCDEITNGLDGETCKIVLDYLKDYASRGNIVIAASHDSEIKNYATKEIQI